MAVDADGHPTWLTATAMSAATLMIAQHIAGKATRDALFLTYFDVSHLPKMMMLSAVVSVVAVLLTSRLLARYGPARLMPPFYLTSALLLACQWFLSTSYPAIAVIVLYLHVSAFNAILISGFWSLINERFDPYAAKAVVARLTAATAFGGLLGGLAAKLVSAAADTHAILWMLSAMHLACAAAVAYLGRGQRHASKTADFSSGLLEPLKRSRLIRRMALLSLLVATTAAVLDYLLKAQASATLAEDQLISFFSYFYMAVGLGTFLLQLAVGNKALRWLGLGGSMAAWPVAILLTGNIALFARSLFTVVAMRASANLLYNSFFRAGFELLYTPINPADKRTGKVLIDVGADRSGDLLGGLVVMSILLLPMASTPLLFITALLLASICLLLILLLHRGYVGQLADNLRSGQTLPQDFVLVDATTINTVASTQTAIDRDRLLRDIAQLRSQQESATSTEPGPMPGDPVVEAIIDLRSNDPTRIRRVLASHTLTPELLPHVIGLLRADSALRETLRALRKVATSSAGGLVDALLDPMQHPLVKRRLPLVLAQAATPLAVHGLGQGLSDPDWNVRLRCAEALESLRRSHPHLKAADKLLIDGINAEVRALSGSEDAWPGGDRDPLRLLFALFGALYDPDTLALCHRALRSKDRNLRGTALEYLENLLPTDLWLAVQPVVAPGLGGHRRKRGLKEAQRNLIAATAAMKTE